ncbi:MAG: IclR family transcriptional regulator, partial [Lacisediminimonas sp.]|nr:IclR family transcriptional regulator [Lacisediminimonas sp.]
AELLKRVDLSRPTLYRLLHTLEQKNFLVSSGDPQRFRLGPAIAKLAHVWTSTLDVASLAMPTIKRIWGETGETVALFLSDGTARVCAAELPSTQPLSFKRGVGYRESLSLGASGRAILAFSAMTEAEEKSWAKAAGKDAASYAMELKQTRKRGYAMSRDELIEGAVAVAVPLYAPDRTVMGSLGVFGPSVRLDQQRMEGIASLLQQAAQEVSRALGGGSA